MAQDGHKMPAVKLFISQLGSIVKPLDGVGEGNMVGFTLRDVTFARVWLQGIVVDVDPTSGFFFVDDGTGTIAVLIADGGGNAVASLPQKGVYVLLVGAVESLLGDRYNDQSMKGTCDRYRILCDVIKNIGSESANRETLWGLEVIDFWRGRGHTSN